MTTTKKTTTDDDAAASSSPPPPSSPPPLPLLPEDASSKSNPNETRVVHLQWNANVDFETKTIRAIATYDVAIVSSKATSIHFDTSALNVKSASIDGEKATFVLSTVDPERKHLGRRLEIMLPSGTSASSVGSKVRVAIEYETTSDCSAVQWLPPSQTAGKVHPYLFTQCQAIHARSLLPCQDRPGVKMTYEASVTVPSWSTCVMSALSKGKKTPSTSSSPPEEGGGGDTATFEFDQPVPISSYLFALAVGDIKSIDVSPRCRVWSEPSVVQGAADEFSQTEDFLKTAEGLTMPYKWGRYDLLCLPPSFPYGGMENPCLTFVTPTLLAGDKSLADVVAHEIAHSWTGNLVTNATWEHFWLNEGWTMWLQRKIVARVKDDPRWFDFDTVGGWKHLADDVEITEDAFTRLVPILGDKDPDDAFSSVPYEKGFNLLYALERRVGTPEFEAFAKSYLHRFQSSTVTSDEFRSYFEREFEGNEAIIGFDWEAWLHDPGMPPETPKFDRTLSKASEDLADAWMAYDDPPLGTCPPKEDITKWSSNRVTCFLDAILTKRDDRGKPLRVSTVRSMKDAYGMHRSSNSEILHRFCMIAIAADDESIVPVAVRFVTSQGRMKFVRPLYRALHQSKMGRETNVAVETFLEHRDFYHPIAAKMVALDLGLTSSTTSSTTEGVDTEETTTKEEKEAGADEAKASSSDRTEGSWRRGAAVSAGAVAAVAVVVAFVLLRRRR